MLRALATVIMLVGCSDRPPSASTQPEKLSLVTLQKLANHVCACKDAPCRDGVRARWTAATEVLPGDVQDPTKMTKLQILGELARSAGYNDIRARYLACLEPDHGPAKTAARIQVYVDRACACDRADPGCLTAVKDEHDRYLADTWTQQDGFTRAEQDAVTGLMQQFQICVHHP